MKDFLHNYSYGAVKMFVNQFAISIFGAMLSMATTAAENDVLAIVLSVLAVIFYLFLIYTMTWEIGAKDRISVDIGKKKYRPHTGLFIALVANIPNFIFAIVYSIGYPFMATYEWAGNMCGVVTLITVFLEGMYLGITTTVSVFGNTLNHYWWTYFLMTVPALLTAWIAYFLGYKNKKFTTLFDYKSPDKPNKK